MRLEEMKQAARNWLKENADDKSYAKAFVESIFSPATTPTPRELAEQLSDIHGFQVIEWLDSDHDSAILELAGLENDNTHAARRYVLLTKLAINDLI